MADTDFSRVPEGLPVPEDDGAADHLPGLHMPQRALPTTAGVTAQLDGSSPGRTVLYYYPMPSRCPPWWRAGSASMRD